MWRVIIVNDHADSWTLLQRPLLRRTRRYDESESFVVMEVKFLSPPTRLSRLASNWRCPGEKAVYQMQKPKSRTCG